MIEIDAPNVEVIEAAMGPERDLVKPRFERGVQCFGALGDGALVGYGWLSVGPEWIGELQLEIRPRPGEGYIWNCSTLLEHRRRGIFRSLLVGISQHARRQGLRRLWIGTMALPAEKALEPAGFRPALRFSSASVAGLHVMRVGAAVDDAIYDVVSIRPGLYVRRSRARAH